MPLTVIDYSEVYFVDLMNEEEVPPQRVGKFVVMWKGEEKFAIFSPTELSRFHGNIVERFLLAQGVKGSFNAEKDVYTFSSEEWKIEGGGIWNVDEEAGLLRITGRSTAYGSADVKTLARELQEGEFFGGIKVEIYKL